MSKYHEYRDPFAHELPSNMEGWTVGLLCQIRDELEKLNRLMTAELEMKAIPAARDEKLKEAYIGWDKANADYLELEEERESIRSDLSKAWADLASRDEQIAEIGDALQVALDDGSDLRAEIRAYRYDDRDALRAENDRLREESIELTKQRDHHASTIFIKSAQIESLKERLRRHDNYETTWDDSSENISFDKTGRWWFRLPPLPEEPSQ